MSQKKPDAFAPVLAVLPELARLTHDELRDLADMLTADLATDPTDHLPARHGLPPVNPADGHSLILHGGWKYRDNPPLYTGAARIELQQAYERADDLPGEARALIRDVARMLQNALAPIGERRRDDTGQPLARGNIQTKIIRRKVLNIDTGEIEVKAFGSYLYYRYHASGGDADRQGKRLKNKYIGLPALAQLFDRTPAGSAERRALEARIITAMNAGTLDTLMIELGLSGTLPKAESDTGTDTPPDAPNAAAGVFLPDYAPAPTRKQPPLHFELSDERREVLAVIAAGLNYAPDHQAGIHGRKIARVLTDTGYLAEVTGESNHRRHRWKLTAAGLSLIRADEDLQRRVTHHLD